MAKEIYNLKIDYKVAQLVQEFHQSYIKQDIFELKCIIYALSKKDIGTLYNLMSEYYPKIEELKEIDSIKIMIRFAHSFLKKANQQFTDQDVKDIITEMFNHPALFKQLCYYLTEDYKIKTMIYFLIKKAAINWITNNKAIPMKEEFEIPDSKNNVHNPILNYS